MNDYLKVSNIIFSIKNSFLVLIIFYLVLRFDKHDCKNYIFPISYILLIFFLILILLIQKIFRLNLKIQIIYFLMSTINFIIGVVLFIIEGALFIATLNVSFLTLDFLFNIVAIATSICTVYKIIKKAF